jgi:hypothetical protein
VTEETRDSLLGPTAELIRDPAYLLARIESILAEGKRYAEMHSIGTGDYHRTEAFSFRHDLKVFADEVRVFTATGDALFEAVVLAVPGLEWHRASSGIFAFVDDDKAGEIGAAALEIPEVDRIGHSRHWSTVRDGIRIDIHGPEPVQESAR